MSQNLTFERPSEYQTALPPWIIVDTGHE